MTLNEALNLTAGSILIHRGMPGRFDSARFFITSAFPARPELGYSPAIIGRMESYPNVTLHITLDGGEECMKALEYYTVDATLPCEYCNKPVSWDSNFTVVVTDCDNFPVCEECSKKRPGLTMVK